MCRGLSVLSLLVLSFGHLWAAETSESSLLELQQIFIEQKVILAQLGDQLQAQRQRLESLLASLRENEQTIEVLGQSIASLRIVIGGLESTLRDKESSLTRLSQDLQTARERLRDSAFSLAQAQQSLKDSSAKFRNERWLWAGGGLVLGLLAGIAIGLLT